MSPLNTSEFVKPPTGMKIQKLSDRACIVHFSGYIETHITLPLSVFDHIDNDQVQQLVEARWQEHRMEDNVIVGNSHGNRDDAVGEQLLKQQLVRAELEVNLLRQCIHSESSALENSGNTINQLITPLRTFRLQDPVA